MKIVLIVLLILVSGWLFFQLNDKANALQEANAKLETVTHERDEATQQIQKLREAASQPRPAVAATPTPGAWFKERLQERPNGLQPGGAPPR